MRRDAISILHTIMTLGFASMTAGAQPPNHMTIDPSPHPNIVLRQFDRAVFPQFVPGLASISPDLDSILVVLENNSDKDAMVITAVWLTTDGRGKPQKIAVSCDGFMGPQTGPVAKAGTRMLVGPNVFLPESMAPTNIGGHFGPLNPQVIRQYWENVQQSNGRLVIDSVIFSDGSLVGPDLLHIADQVQARPLAARAVASAADEALSQGRPLLDAMTQFTAKSAASMGEVDYEARSASRFAHELLQLRGGAQRSYINYLHAMPASPPITRPN